MSGAVFLDTDIFIHATRSGGPDPKALASARAKGVASRPSSLFLNRFNRIPPLRETPNHGHARMENPFPPQPS